MYYTSKKYQYSADMRTTKELLPIIRQIFPSLKARKGDNGRVAVIGGSYQFTGAPFYSAITSLKVGGDLAHIFCPKSAATAIKSYSPEIIVHPVFVSSSEVKLKEEQLDLVHKQWLEQILKWKLAIRSWVIGPGLGRDQYMNKFFPILVRNLPEGSLLVFDADALYFLSQHPDLLKDLKRFKVILTPNHRQVGFLKKIMDFDIDSILEKYNKEDQELQQIPSDEQFKDFTVYFKGQQDLILGPKYSFIVRTTGGQKRCGGLGDLLGGALAVCAQWNYDYGPLLAARIIRIATLLAFEKQGRGLTAPVVTKELPYVVQKIQSASL